MERSAHDLKDKASDLVANVRDHIPSPGQMVSKVRDHLPSMHEAGHRADENPMLVALGGLALGAVAALLLPVSRKERELLEPGQAAGRRGDGRAERKARRVGAAGAGPDRPAAAQAPGQTTSQVSTVGFSEPGGPLLTH